jgi:hypothetical protein
MHVILTNYSATALMGGPAHLNQLAINIATPASQIACSPTDEQEQERAYHSSLSEGCQIDELTYPAQHTIECKNYILVKETKTLKIDAALRMHEPPDHWKLPETHKPFGRLERAIFGVLCTVAYGHPEMDTVWACIILEEVGHEGVWDEGIKQTMERLMNNNVVVSVIKIVFSKNRLLKHGLGGPAVVCICRVSYHRAPKTRHGRLYSTRSTHVYSRLLRSFHWMDYRRVVYPHGGIQVKDVQL